MDQRPATGASRDSPGRAVDGGFWLVLILAAALLAVVLGTGLRGWASSDPTGGGTEGGKPGGRGGLGVGGTIG